MERFAGDVIGSPAIVLCSLLQASTMLAFFLLNLWLSGAGTQSFLRHPVRENDRTRKARRKSPRPALLTSTPVARSIFAGTGEIDRKSTVVK